MVMDKKKILFVDDDADFLSTATALLAEKSEQTWEFLPASSGGDALAALQKGAVDLMLLDVHMPVLDGVQLLGLLQRKWPSLPKVVLTGHASPEERASCLSSGAEMVLEKPTEPDGWHSIHAVIDSLLQASKEEGFQGVMRRVNLPDVIQMECLAANSSVLEVKGAGLKGRIFIREGRIIHATIGDLTGVPALNEVLALPGGGFQLLPFQDPGESTIEGSWEFLLMEAARQQDEVAGGQLEDGGSEGTKAPASGTSLMPTDLDSIPDMFQVPGSKSAPPAQQPVGKAPDLDSIPDVFKAPQPAAAAETSTGPETSTETATRQPADDDPKPTIEETMICSLQGNLLYQWQSPDPQSRISLLEFLTRRAASLSSSLPLGQFERFEAVDDRNRCLVRLHADRALFVRVSNPSKSDPEIPA